MHAATDIPDAQNRDLCRYLDLHAGLKAAPVDDQPLVIPHLDADARDRAARNELIAGLDHLIANASAAVGVVAGIVGLGASAQVILQFVGGV
jgi:hypothetical protein